MRPSALALSFAHSAYIRCCILCRCCSSLPQVANLPLIPNCPVPKELHEIDQTRIVGLIIDPVCSQPSKHSLRCTLFD